MVLVGLGSVLAELVDDAGDDAHEFGLQSVVHVQDESDVLAPVVAFDGDSQQ